MDIVKYLGETFHLDYSQPSPFILPIGRFKDVPRIFKKAGFKVGAEVGVFEGEYSKWLLRLIPGLKLYGVDLWELYPGYKDFKPSDMAAAYEKAKTNTAGYDCELIKDWSSKAVTRFADESLDFVFIDGNHAYEWVVMDIFLWSKKVRPGGVIYGHDYDDYSKKRRWAEMNVVNAVDGWVKSYRIHPWYVIARNTNRSWLYVKS